MRKVFALFMMMLVAFLLLAADNRESSTYVEREFVIEAIIPGSSSSGDSGYGELVVRDLYGNSTRNIRDTESIDIGVGSDIRTTEPQPLFIVEYTTNSTSPVTLTVNVSPFVSTTLATVNTIATTIHRETGYHFSSVEVAEYYDSTESIANGAISNTSRNDKSITGGVTVNPAYGAGSSNIDISSLNSPLTDELSFDIYWNEDVNGSWNYDQENGYYTYSRGGTFVSQDSGLIKDDGMITYYAEYSASIPENVITADGFPADKYVMNVSVGVTAE